MKNKQGISLIVLIITIIVMIILAGAVILSMTRSNIIDNVGEAKFKSNVKSYEEELALMLGDYYKNNPLVAINTINASTPGELKRYIPSIKEEDLNKFIIQDGELAYKLTLSKEERKYAHDAGIAREIEIFDTTTSYGNLYVNPSPTLRPDKIKENWVNSNNNGNYSVCSWFDSNDNNNGGRSLEAVKSDFEPMGPDVIKLPQMVAIHRNNEEDGEQCIYFFEDVTLPAPISAIVKVGWNNINMAESPAIVTPVNPSELTFINAGIMHSSMAIENLGHYLSTVEYP